MGTVNFTQIWVDPPWTCPPILIATLVSSIVLAFLVMRWIKLLIWLRTQVVPDRVGKIIVIHLIPASFIGIAIFQFWFGAILYRDHYEMDPTISVGIPIYPVWLVGAICAVIYTIICQRPRRTGVSNSLSVPESGQ
jgi:hypothetical protein